MFLEFVKDEATVTEVKLKLHLFPADIICSAAMGKKKICYTGDFCLFFSVSWLFLVLLCGLSMSQLKLWSHCFFNSFFPPWKLITWGFFQLMKAGFILC